MDSNDTVEESEVTADQAESTSAPSETDSLATLVHKRLEVLTKVISKNDQAAVQAHTELFQRSSPVPKVFKLIGILKKAKSTEKRTAWTAGKTKGESPSTVYILYESEARMVTVKMEDNRSIRTEVILSEENLASLDEATLTGILELVQAKYKEALNPLFAAKARQ